MKFFHCMKCSSTCENAEEFLSHSCQTSFELKDISCDTCGKKLASLDSVRLHLNSHEGLIVYLNISDEVCGKCSAACGSKTCFSTSEKEIKEIQDQLGKLSKSELHNFLLNSLVTQNKFGLDVSTYRFGSSTFCCDAMKSFFDVLSL